MVLVHSKTSTALPATLNEPIRSPIQTNLHAAPVDSQEGPRARYMENLKLLTLSENAHQL